MGDGENGADGRVADGISPNRGQARSGLILWLARPSTKRPKDIPTLERFCDVFHISMPDAYSMMAEVGFMNAVMNDRTYWQEAFHDVMAAVKRNAEDPQRSDQLVWVTAYATLIGHGSAADLEAIGRPRAGK